MEPHNSPITVTVANGAPLHQVGGFESAGEQYLIVADSITATEGLHGQIEIAFWTFQGVEPNFRLWVPAAMFQHLVRSWARAIDFRRDMPQGLMAGSTMPLYEGEAR